MIRNTPWVLLPGHAGGSVVRGEADRMVAVALAGSLIAGRASRHGAAESIDGRSALWSPAGFQWPR